MTRHARGSDDSAVIGTAPSTCSLGNPDGKGEPSVPTAFLSGIFIILFLLKTINSLTQTTQKWYNYRGGGEEGNGLRDQQVGNLRTERPNSRSDFLIEDVIDE